MWYREKITKIRELELEMVSSSPENYKIKPSELLTTYRQTLMPWVVEEKKNELVDLIRALDFVNNQANKASK